MRLYDTHCHLDARFDVPLDTLIADARAEGVAAMVLPGVAPESWARSAAVASRFPEVHLALGIHPQAVRDLSDAELNAGLDALPAQLAGCVAVGEIGLDHLADRDPAQRARQRRTFLAQLDIAATLGLPPLIHCVKAHGALLELWADHPCRRNLPGVLHAYSGSADLVPRFVELGLFLSIAGGVTVPNARRLPAAVPAIPDDRLLIETDAPYQPPHPLEGRPNRPGRLREVARAVAALRGVGEAHVAAVTWRNATTLFKAPR